MPFHQGAFEPTTSGSKRRQRNRPEVQEQNKVLGEEETTAVHEKKTCAWKTYKEPSIKGQRRYLAPLNG